MCVVVETFAKLKMYHISLGLLEVILVAIKKSPINSEGENIIVKYTKNFIVNENTIMYVLFSL